MARKKKKTHVRSALLRSLERSVMNARATWGEDNQQYRSLLKLLEDERRRVLDEIAKKQEPSTPQFRVGKTSTAKQRHSKQLRNELAVNRLMKNLKIADKPSVTTEELANETQNDDDDFYDEDDESQDGGVTIAEEPAPKLSKRRYFDRRIPERNLSKIIELADAERVWNETGLSQARQSSRGVQSGLVGVDKRVRRQMRLALRLVEAASIQGLEVRLMLGEEIGNSGRCIRYLKNALRDCPAENTASQRGKADNAEEHQMDIEVASPEHEPLGMR